jgi:ABC-2 type transport system permease protein
MRAVSSWRLMAFDWQVLRAERSVWPLMVLLAVAVLYAGANGTRWTDSVNRTIDEARLDESTRLGALRATLDSLASDSTPLRAFGDPRSPYAAAQSQARRFTLLPQAALAPLAIGQSDLFPSFHRVSALSRETFLANDELENPLHMLSGRFDIAFVAVFLFPLLIIALSYNVISGEREGGTLALLGAQPVELTRVVEAKLGLRALIVFAASVLIVPGGALIAGVRLDDSALLLLPLWFAVAFVYGLVWLSASVLVNTMGRSSSANALILLAIWLVSTVLVPSGLVAAVNAMHPTPSRVTLMSATREASNGASARGSQLMAMYYQDHPELMAGAAPDMNNFGTRAIAVAADVRKATAGITAQFDTALAGQQRLSDRWRYLSPTVLAHDAFIHLSRTDGERFLAFRRQADGYVATLQSYFAPLIARGERLTPGDIAAMPAFVFEDSTQASVRNRALQAVMTLVLLSAVMLAMARRRMRHIAVIG